MEIPPSETIPLPLKTYHASKVEKFMLWIAFQIIVRMKKNYQYELEQTQEFKVTHFLP